MNAPYGFTLRLMITPDELYAIKLSTIEKHGLEDALIYHHQKRNECYAEFMRDCCCVWCAIEEACAQFGKCGIISWIDKVGK